MIKYLSTLLLKWKNRKKKNKFYTKDFEEFKNYDIGEHTYGRPKLLHWDEGATLRIGKFCSIADDVKIFLGGNHRIDWVSTYPFNILNKRFPKAKSITGHPISKGNVIIGNDVWIGMGVTILSGCEIGDGAVIGAGAVVTKSVSPYAVIVGNPGKEVKKRFSDTEIKFLLDLKWWNWSISEINDNINFICNDVEMLKIKYEKKIK